MISQENYNFIKKIMLQKAGIDFSDNKQYFLISRLKALIDELNISSIDKLINKIILTSDNLLMNKLIASLTINESSFFRNKRIYEILVKEIIPFLIKIKNNNKINICSVGCAKGQEPYSIAMQLYESNITKDYEIAILASDISFDIINLAKKGIYTSYEISRGIDDYFLKKYFTKNSNNNLQINDQIRKLVNFSNHNLLDSIIYKEKFDIVFCRNLFIYFCEEAKNKALKNMLNNMNNQAILILGSTESLSALEIYNLKKFNSYHDFYIYQY